MGSCQGVNACRFLTHSTSEDSGTLVIKGGKYILYNINIRIYVIKIMEKFEIFRNYWYLKYTCIKTKVWHYIWVNCISASAFTWLTQMGASLSMLLVIVGTCHYRLVCAW